MHPLSPRDERLGSIDILHADVTRLLGVATHDSIRNFLLQARQELDGASTILHRPGIEARPDLLEIVDLLLAAASSRLILSSRVLHTDGPDGILPDDDA